MDPNFQWYFCKYCRMVFRTKEDLSHHRQKKHPNKINKAKKLAQRVSNTNRSGLSINNNNNEPHPISTIREESVVEDVLPTSSNLQNTNYNVYESSISTQQQQPQTLSETQSSSLIINPSTSSNLIDDSQQQQQPPPLGDDEFEIIFARIYNETSRVSSSATPCPPSYPSTARPPEQERQDCVNCNKKFLTTESFIAHLPLCNIEALDDLIAQPSVGNRSISTDEVDQCDLDSGIYENRHVGPGEIFGSHVREENNNEVQQQQQQQQQEQKERSLVHTLHELTPRKRKFSTSSSIPSTSSSNHHHSHQISDIMDNEGGKVPILRIRKNDQDTYSASLLQMHRAPTSSPPSLQSLLSSATAESTQSITPSPPSLLHFEENLGRKRRKCTELTTRPTTTTTATFNPTRRLRERKSTVHYNYDEDNDDDPPPPVLVCQDEEKYVSNSSTYSIYPSPASTVSSASTATTTTTTTTMDKMGRKRGRKQKNPQNLFSPSFNNNRTNLCTTTTTTSTSSQDEANIVREYNGPFFFYLAGNFVELRKLSTYSLKDHVYSDVSSFSSISSETNCALKYDGHDSIYVLGGQSGGLYGKATNEIQIYDLSTGKWRMGKNKKNPNPKMINERCEFEACIVDGYIYAIGGDQMSNGFWKNMNCVERLPLRPVPGKKWKWENVDFLKYSRQNFGVAALNGKIYVVGGYAGSKNKKTSNAAKGTSSVESLDTTMEKDGEDPEWQNEPGLVTSRVGPCVVATDEGLLYCIGGGTEFNEETSERFNTMEILNPKRKPLRWVLGPTMNRKRQFFSAFVHEKAIYAVGGEYGAHPTIEKYDLESRVWSMVKESILDLTGNYWSIAFKS